MINTIANFTINLIYDGVSTSMAINMTTGPISYDPSALHPDSFQPNSAVGVQVLTATDILSNPVVSATLAYGVLTVVFGSAMTAGAQDQLIGYLLF